MAAERKSRLGRAASQRETPASVNNVDLVTTFDLGVGRVDGPMTGIANFERFGGKSHFRFQTDDPETVGRGEMCDLDDGLHVHVMETERQQPSVMQVSGSDLLRVRIASEGCGEYAPSDGAPVSFDGPGAMVIIEPAGQPPADVMFDGRNRYVHVYAHRSALLRLFGSGARIPSVLQSFLDGSLQRTVVRRLPLTTALLRCLEDLQTCTQQDVARRLYIQSKAVEIVCLALEKLEEEDDVESAESSLMISRGVVKARDILTERFVSPPSLDDLSHEVGLSRASLCTGFRKILGQSVFDYILELKMQHALVLLNEHGASVTDVAYAVGYTHPASFTVAVQRRFGATPRELRKASVAAPTKAIRRSRSTPTA
jgi:AraC family transcriptional activator of pyochelin receptor